MCLAMASRDDDSILRIEKFDGQNFHLWKFKMQMVLEDKDLWDIAVADWHPSNPPGKATKGAPVGGYAGGVSGSRKGLKVAGGGGSGLD